MFPPSARAPLFLISVAPVNAIAPVLALRVLPFTVTLAVIRKTPPVLRVPPREVVPKFWMRTERVSFVIRLKLNDWATAEVVTLPVVEFEVAKLSVLKAAPNWLGAVELPDTPNERPVANRTFPAEGLAAKPTYFREKSGVV